VVDKPHPSTKETDMRRPTFTNDSPTATRTGRTVRRSLLLAGGVLPLALFASGSEAAVACQSVRGSYVEHAVADNCTSPIGFCITATYRGSLRGTLDARATSIAPTADTGATGVLVFTSESTFDGAMRDRTGTLAVRNAGTFRTTGAGSIVDLQTIVGGTGDFAGATGELRASGTFVDGAGMSEYEGQVCLP
jgi:Protein of unknown function (DUF3224)